MSSSGHRAVHSAISASSTSNIAPIRASNSNGNGTMPPVGGDNCRLEGPRVAHHPNVSADAAQQQRNIGQGQLQGPAQTAPPNDLWRTCDLPNDDPGIFRSDIGNLPSFSAYGEVGTRYTYNERPNNPPATDQLRRQATVVNAGDVTGGGQPWPLDNITASRSQPVASYGLQRYKGDSTGYQQWWLANGGSGLKK